MKKIVISCGPIPARLDSVKYITNKFKGGLAFTTAKYLMDKHYSVTIVKWINTPLPDGILPIERTKAPTIINVKDVFEYYNWFSDNALNYDAFIMAAAVANLTPSHPYEGKFPSHNYSVGEKFNIEFEIAPRAIDIIKEKNPKACLIGYKLFDAKSDIELVNIARHTLHDSKANVIFANTPRTAKTKKIAILQDNSIIPMDFNEHLNFIHNTISQTYFSTSIIKPSQEEIEAMAPYKALVEIFEKTFNGFGTVAFKVPGYGFVTTSRGHKAGSVYVRTVDSNSTHPTVYAEAKATLNAPALWAKLNNEDCDYVIHRHDLNTNYDKCIGYVFPGTLQEYKNIIENSGKVMILYHGYLFPKKYSSIDWSKYHDIFPSKYFSTPQEITDAVEQNKNKKILEVGANDSPIAEFVLDPYCETSKAINISYKDLENMKFDLIILRNSIAYLSESEINLLIKSLNPNGKILANTFIKAPELKKTENEVSVKRGDTITHYLVNPDDSIVRHSFYSRNAEWYSNLGFVVTSYGKSSALVQFDN